MRKKVMAVGLSGILVMTFFTGCAGENSEKDKEKIKIRFATWDVAEDVEYQQEFVDEFNESQDEIEVDFEAYGSEFDTKVSAGMGAGDAPDVMYMWNYPAYAEGLEPLDEYITKAGGEEYKEKFNSTLWAYNSYGEKIYGVPVGFATHALFYNKDLFEEAELDYPNSEWTWKDLQEAAKCITEKTDAKGFAFQMKPDPYDFEMYLWSNGTSYCDEEGNLKGYLDSEKSIEVFSVFQNMEKDGYAIATEKNGTDEFRSGQAAMYVCATWPLESLRKDGMNYGVEKIPSFGAGKSVSILTSSGMAISKDSKNKEAAWEFVKFYSEKAYAKAHSEMEVPGEEAFLEMLDQSDGYTPASFLIKNWSEVSEDLSLAFEEIFNPSSLQNVSEVLKKAVEQ